MIPSVLIAVLVITALTAGGMATTAASLPLDGWSVQHSHLGTAVGGATILLLAWIALKHSHTRKLAGLLAVGMLAQAALRGGFAHAVLGQALVACSVALCVLLSKSWTREPQLIQDYGWPSLRSLAFLLPALIVVQIGLGAAFRHQLLSVIPHVVGAMLVAMFILMVGSFVLQQCKQNKTLLLWGRVLIGMTCLQLVLGIAAFTFRAVPKTDPHRILLMSTAHVAVASLVLASSVVLGMFIRRNVTPKA